MHIAADLIKFEAKFYWKANSWVLGLRLAYIYFSPKIRLDMLINVML